MLQLSDINAVILVGGLGTRLKGVVADRPKVLAPVRNRPFLTFLLDKLAAAGLKKVVLGTGYRAEMICAAIGERYKSLRVVHSRETSPLGTGGALRQALTYLDSDPILVMNGDSYCTADLRNYWQWFLAGERPGALLLARVPETSRFGRVRVGDDDLVVSFEEKGAQAGPGWINAGIYLLRRQVVEAIPAGTFYSLEQELFPLMADQKRLHGYRSEAAFIDIGTPAAYAEADKFFTERDL